MRKSFLLTLFQNVNNHLQQKKLNPPQFSFPISKEFNKLARFENVSVDFCFKIIDLYLS